MTLFKQISKTFWSTSVWLPPNITWEDIAPGSRQDVDHADYRDLWWPLFMALVLLAIRYVVETYILSPFGKSLGIKSTRSKRASPNPVLEAAYNQCSRLHHKTVIGLTKQVDMTERQIERWWRYRRAQDKPSTLVKFCENSWRFIYYTYSFAFGLYVLWDKQWFWDVKNCWYGYPHQSVDSEIWSYYMFSMSFYWSLVVSQFFDVKRKDFWQMFVHHIVTLLLIAFSWVCNLHRVGSLVLVIHDCADIFLELAKITKYAGYQKLCDGVFAIFTIVWIVTRLGFYPRIIYSTSVEAPRFLPMFPAYYIFNGLLISLLLLHIAWTYMILKVAYESLKSGKMEGDCRSSSSELSESSESVKAAVANGTPQKKNSSKSRSISKSPKHPKQTTN